MTAMPRQAAYTPVSASLLLNVYATEIERVVSGTFGNLTNTGRPRFLLTRTSDLSVPNVTDSIISWQGVTSDPRSMWTASVPDIVTIKDPGDWLLFGQQRWAPNSTGTRRARLFLNGTNDVNVIADPVVPGTSDGEGTTIQVFAFARFAVNDLIRQGYWQNSGGSLLNQTNYGGTFFSGVWLGP